MSTYLDLFGSQKSLNSNDLAAETAATQKSRDLMSYHFQGGQHPDSSKYPKKTGTTTAPPPKKAAPFNPGAPDVAGLKKREANIGLDDSGVFTKNLGTFTRNGKTQDVTANNQGGLFLGNSPVKESMFIRSEAAKTLPGVGGTPAPAIPGMPASQSMMPGGNWTGLMDMETAALTSAMKPGAGVPGATQPSFGSPGQPGPGQDGDRVYREIESQISSLFNTQKALISGNYSPSGMGSLSPGQRMRYAGQLGEQIKGLQDTLTNRSGLANELVKALIGAQTATATANTAAGAELGKASITGAATVDAAGVTAKGDVVAAQNKQATDADNKAKMRRHSDLSALVSSYQKEYETAQSPEVKSKLDEARRELAALNVEVGDWDFSKAPN